VNGQQEALRFFADGLDAHKRGDLARAEALYVQALKADPKQGDALHYLGFLHRQKGNAEAAVRLIGEAIEVAPNATAHRHLADALQALGRLQEAVVQYDKALELKSDLAAAWDGRGTALQNLGNQDAALASYERSLALNPKAADTWNNYGKAQRAMKRPNDAIAAFDRAIALDPAHIGAITSRGMAFFDMKAYDEALGCFVHALTLNPDSPDAHYARGILHVKHRRYAEAAIEFEAVLATAGDHGFDRLPAMDDAGDDAARLHGLKLAAEWLARSRKYARGNLLHARMNCCDWRDYDAQLARIEAELRAGNLVVTPFAFQTLSSSPADLRLCSEIFVAENYPAKPPLWRGEPYAHRKIRVGYVAGEFREHATSFLTVGMFEHHDRDRFEIYAFDKGTRDEGATRKRLEAAFDGFVDIARKSDADAAAEIRRREIDILVDLNGFFGEEQTGIFSHRPAPLQVNYLGFPATLGAPYFDYIIADATVIPHAEEKHYVEKVVWLPDTYQVTDDRRVVAETPARAQVGLPENAFVFCCFNNPYKLTPYVFDVWMRILTQVENSVLWLPESNSDAGRNLRREAQARGVSGDRIIFAPFAKQDEHLARLALADLFLDTLPYNAHTTASDALWAGLPVITCRGTAFPGRVAASLLQAIGMPELITETLEDYERLALSLAKDKAKLAACRTKLAQNRLSQPLFKTAQFTRHIEAAFLGMQARLAQNQPPQSFAVEALR
jgi:predicted O-linked N-acetylglucosamine transferase (SPINDLY family)